MKIVTNKAPDVKPTSGEPDPSGAPEFLKAKRQHQRWVFLGLALLSAIAVWLLLQLVHQLDAARVISIKSVRTAAEQTMQVAGSYFRLVAGGLAACGLYLNWTGYRIFRSGQYPAPDTWVVRDTRIRRGWRAKSRATFAVVVGVALVGLALVFPEWADTQVAHLLLDALQTPDTPADAFLPQVE